MQFLRVPAMLLLLAATPCVAKCHKDYFKYVHGSETSTTMHVSSGASCVIKFTISGKSTIDSIAIAEQAKHGAASWNGFSGYPAVTYRSSPGYRGQDEFLLSISGASSRSDSPANLRVSVVVE
jgi:hypothetical protein